VLVIDHPRHQGRFGDLGHRRAQRAGHRDPVKVGHDQVMQPQQDRDHGDQHPADRVVGGQQQPRVRPARPVQDVSGDGAAHHPRQAEAQENHA
jgi:hypothetical protein